MFLVRFIRQLLAIPLVLAAMVAALVSPPLSARLQEWVWLVGGDQTAGLAVLLKYLPIEGPEAVRARAARMLAAKPSSAVATYSGLLALDAGDLDEAQAMLDLARDLGPDPQGFTELLEFHLAYTRADGPTATRQVAREMSQRRDLSPTVSKLVLTNLLWLDLSQQEFDRARGRAEHMLAIEDDPQLETVLETLHLHAGRHDKARRCAARAASAAPAERLYWQCLTSHAVGLHQRGDEAMAELRDHDEARADNAARLLAEAEDA